MPAGQGITIRGQNVGSATASFTTKPAAGSAIIVGIAGRNTLYDADYSTSTITDTGGNTYTKRSFYGGYFIYGVELWVAENVTVPSGTWTITVTCTKTTSQYFSGFAQEWVGAISSGVFDKEGTGSAVAAATSVATASTGVLTQADEVAFSALCLITDDTDANIVPPSGWTMVDVVENMTSYTGFGLAYKEVAATTALAPSWSFDAVTYHATAAVVTIKTVSSAGTTTITGTGDLPSVLSLTLETPAAAVAIGATDTLDITVLDDLEVPLENATPTVVASPTGIVTVGTPTSTNASGVATVLITGAAVGTTNLTASVGGKSSSVVPFSVVSTGGGLPPNLFYLLHDSESMMQMKQSEATAERRRIPFKVFDDDSADAYAVKTGLTFSAGEILLSKNGASEVNGVGTVTEEAGGDYYYQATQTELDTLGYVKIRVAKTDCYPVSVKVQVVSFDPYDSAGLGLSYLPNAVPTADANATAVWTQANAIETGITPAKAMRALGAMLTGILTGARTGTEVFRGLNSSTVRVTMTVDSSGNRSGVVLTLD